MENQINFFTIQDIFNSVDKGEPIDITKTYDPLHFWEDYGDKYFKDYKSPQDFARHTPWLISRLKHLKCDTLYNAGCGFGRIEPFLLQAGVVKEITSGDISHKQLESAKEYLKDFPMKDKIKFINQSIKWSNMPANSFDCTMSVECMQHLPLSSVRYAMKQLQKLAKKYVIVVERFIYDGEHSMPNVWSHNYPKIANDYGLEVLESTIANNGVIAMVMRK